MCRHVTAVQGRELRETDVLLMQERLQSCFELALSSVVCRWSSRRQRPSDIKDPSRVNEDAGRESSRARCKREKGEMPPKEVKNERKRKRVAKQRENKN